MNDCITTSSSKWASALRSCTCNLTEPDILIEGKLTRAVGLTLEATGIRAPVGSRCSVTGTGDPVDMEIVGFSDQKVFLMPVDRLDGLSAGARVVPSGSSFKAPVGDSLLGRVIDGTGAPIDGLGVLSNMSSRSIESDPINPLKRQIINNQLDVGIRSINGLLTLGRGQRIGLFAGSGVGKSQLLGMITRNCDADVVVIGMIGERGREVKSFVDQTLGEIGRGKSVVIAAPADNTAMRRLHGAKLAMSIAEHFRDRGKHVLLLMDSLTRFAQAQREIGLAVGEPPTTKGYPPSVFQTLSQLLERAGVGPIGGSVTAIYTVLAEGDDQHDPVVDAARAVLDGHIVLSRKIAESGVYPAIDLEASISRLTTDLNDGEQVRAINVFRELYSTYQQNLDVINLGLYQQGSNPAIDRAVHAWPRLRSYMQQNRSEIETMEEARNQLLSIANDYAIPQIAE